MQTKNSFFPCATHFCLEDIDLSSSLKWKIDLRESWGYGLNMSDIYINIWLDVFLIYLKLYFIDSWNFSISSYWSNKAKLHNLFSAKSIFGLEISKQVMNSFQEQTIVETRFNRNNLCERLSFLSNILIELPNLMANWLIWIKSLCLCYLSV